jgi:hypothetical protein
MAPARIEVNQGDALHRLPILPRPLSLPASKTGDFMQMSIIQSVYLIALY